MPVPTSTECCQHSFLLLKGISMSVELDTSVALEAHRLCNELDEHMYPVLNVRLNDFWTSITKLRRGQYFIPKPPRNDDHGPWPGRGASQAAKFAKAATSGQFCSSQPRGSIGFFDHDFIPNLVWRQLRHGIPRCRYGRVAVCEHRTFVLRAFVRKQGDVIFYQSPSYPDPQEEQNRNFVTSGFIFAGLTFNLIEEESNKLPLLINTYSRYCSKSATPSDVRIDMQQLLGMYYTIPEAIDMDTETLAGNPGTVPERLNLLFHAIDFIRYMI